MQVGKEESNSDVLTTLRSLEAGRANTQTH